MKSNVKVARKEAALLKLRHTITVSRHDFIHDRAPCPKYDRTKGIL